MAYGEFYVERQYWVRFPKVLIMCRKHGRMENGNCAVERMRYVPERTCECVAEYAKSPIDGKTIVLHRCSACHELMRPHMAYCPNCGCKVVGE